MSFLRPDPPPAPVMPEAPPPVLAPTGTKPGNKSQTKSFLGTGAIANPTSATSGVAGAQPGKTLLGQ